MLHYWIVYSKEPGGSIKPLGYVDADYGGDLDTRKSTSGYIFMMAGGTCLMELKTTNYCSAVNNRGQIHGNDPSFATSAMDAKLPS